MVLPLSITQLIQGVTICIGIQVAYIKTFPQHEDRSKNSIWLYKINLCKVTNSVNANLILLDP